MNITPCQLGPIGPLPPLNGHPRVRADCACGITFGAWDEPEIRGMYALHLTIRRPSDDVLAKDEPDVDDVRANPRFFVYGPGRRVTAMTRCPHDYYLTDSCPGCDADQERAEAEARA